MFCRQCGADVGEGGRFCQLCGAEVSLPKSQVAREPSAAHTPTGRSKASRRRALLLAIGVVAVVALVLAGWLTGWPSSLFSSSAGAYHDAEVDLVMHFSGGGSTATLDGSLGGDRVDLTNDYETATVSGSMGSSDAKVVCVPDMPPYDVGSSAGDEKPVWGTFSGSVAGEPVSVLVTRGDETSSESESGSNYSIPSTLAGSLGADKLSAENTLKMLFADGYFAELAFTSFGELGDGPFSLRVTPTFGHDGVSLHLSGQLGRDGRIELDLMPDGGGIGRLGQTGGESTSVKCTGTIGGTRVAVDSVIVALAYLEASMDPGFYEHSYSTSE